MQTNTVTLENSLIVSPKTEYATTLWSSIPVPGQLSQRNDDYVYTNTCTQMLIAVLFIIVENWKKKNPICSSVGEWLYRPWSTRTMVCCSAVQIKPPAWLSRDLCDGGKKRKKKKSQYRKVPYFVCPFIEHFYKWQVYRIVDSRDEEWRMKTRRGRGCGCKRETALVGKTESMWTFWLCYRSIYLLQ